ncbi:hypothetical protein CEP51_005614 [Fusarium floridanum]|uniref:CENP-V/GFA domain-containing protein n=1 Tax=Fusarium floridanum TaxID=1325733 RepID=A0A428RW50_9HYPO|nr:hypothetical protein CEP51_005614 [Fusarium floridanum]
MTTGSCACGALRYSFNSAPVVSALCHCNGFKKSSSSNYTHNLIVPAVSFTTSGTAKECGTPLYITSEGAPGAVIVKAGTLDDPSLNEVNYRPTVEMFCKEKYSWLPDIERARKFHGAMKH